MSWDQIAVLAQAADDGGGIAALIAPLIFLALLILIFAGMWATFAKAGEPGWAAIVPIYNAVVMLKIAGRPIWWVLLLLIPFVGAIVAIIASIDIAKNFGKGTGFGLGLAFLGFIFYPILGFGDAKYIGKKS